MKMIRAQERKSVENMDGRRSGESWLYMSISETSVTRPLSLSLVLSFLILYRRRSLIIIQGWKGVSLVVVVVVVVEVYKSVWK